MRFIVAPEMQKSQAFRVAILNYEPVTQTEGCNFKLLHLLEKAGHISFFRENSHRELSMNTLRINRIVYVTQADAWVACCGFREVIQWFAGQLTPVIAMFGRRGCLPIAAIGPGKPPAMEAATRALAGFGHRRIVLLVRSDRRMQGLGASEKKFIGELSAHGIPFGSYHLPHWENSIDGFHSCLEEFFRFSPPTALIVDGSGLFAATQQFLSRRELRMPKHISLVCTDNDPSFEWCRPSITHIRWDSRPVLRRIVRWAANVSLGKENRR